MGKQEEIKKVYINAQGEINFSAHGRLAKLEDLTDELCYGSEPFEGLLQIEEGIFYWISAEQQMKIFENDESITKEEFRELEEECEGEYVRVNGNIPLLYKKFIEDMDEVFEEVVSVTFDEDDCMLCALTISRNRNWSYSYNYSKNTDDGNIESNMTSIPALMLTLGYISNKLHALQ